MPTYTGEACKQDFIYVDRNPAQDAPELDLLNNPFSKCCFKLTVFASTTDSDPFKNDKTRFLYRFPLSVSSCVLTLQKKVNGTWTDQATLNDNTYGTFSAFGFARKGTPEQDLISYYLDWRTVLSAFDYGNYRVKRTFSGVDRFSEQYCLKSYSAKLADRSVRITYTLDSILGDKNDSKLTVDYSGLELENMIRIPNAIFGFTDSDYEIEQVRFDDGREYDFRNEQTQKWVLELRKLDSNTHDIIRDIVLQSDNLLISDYNRSNPIPTIINQPVVIDGGYSPSYGNNPLYPVRVNFKNLYNNKRKRYC